MRRPPLRRPNPYWLLAVLGSLLAAATIAATHSPASIISFDEGFHGGAAIFVRETLRYLLHLPGSVRPTYLIGEFQNGITLYPPLWILVAGLAGFLFGASTEVFRAATLLFYVGALLFTFWFVSRARGGDSKDAQWAGLAAAAVLASVPMVVIYSHLMMLEVPLMLGVTAIVGCSYLYSLDLLPRRPGTILLLAAVCAGGALTKLAAYEVAWATFLGFAILSSLLFWRQRFYRHFLKWELLLFLAASVGAMYGYIFLIKRYLGVDMTAFYNDQSANQQGAGVGHATALLQVWWAHRWVYWKDFSHIPALATVWFGSLAAYAAWKRTSLSILLLVWVAVVYAAFTAVSPQVAQYIMPLYVPLAMATGLMVYDLCEVLPLAVTARRMIAVSTVGLLALVQSLSLPKSESYGWRDSRSGVEQASQYLAAHAATGDRVMVWHDGVTYSVRVAGLDKRVQIYNSVNQQCEQAMDDSFEWALGVSDPPAPSATDQRILSAAPWQLVRRYGPAGTTVLYHNTGSTWPLQAEAEDFSSSQRVADPTAGNGLALLIDGSQSQPAYWGCYRELRLGVHTATFRLRPTQLADSIPTTQDVLRLEYAGYPSGEYFSRTVTAGELRATGGYADYEFPVDHEKIDRPGELKVFMLVPGQVLLDRVVVR